MLCFERGAASEALRKLYLIIKPLYKIRQLDLLSKGEALDEETLRKQELCIFWSQKIRCFTLFASVICFES